MNSVETRKMQVYSKIDLDTRKKLVKLVVQDERSLSKTAAKLGIKLSTAKIIIKKYKLTGEFFESKAERARRQELERQMRESLSSSGKLAQNQALNPSIDTRQYNSNPTMPAVQMDGSLFSPWFHIQPIPYGYPQTVWLPWSI